MRVFALLLLAIAAIAAAPSTELRAPNRIVGGSVTTINVYPFGAALLYSSFDGTYWQWCGGTIINNRSILSAAHCFFTGNRASQWRIRVGSTWANSGGVVHNTNSIIMHPNYNGRTEDNDFAILRSSGTFSFNNNVRAGSIAGANYNLADNQAVWAIGWGTISSGGPSSEQLRHVQVYTINQSVCNQRYNGGITANMLCSGVLNVGGRDQCQGDSGGPLIHNNVVVGVCSWGAGCADPWFPGVNARVSAASNWIVNNA